MYCRAGQQTEEEMYNNEEGGPAFNEFLDVIGQRVRLKGFGKYKAGLCNKSELIASFSQPPYYHPPASKHLIRPPPHLLIFIPTRMLKYFWRRRKLLCSRCWVTPELHQLAPCALLKPLHYGEVVMGGGTFVSIHLCQLCLSFYQRPNISDRFVNFASHFIRIQILQICF